MALVFSLAILPAQGILFYSTGDPTYNTTAPTGTLANSGWQYQGLWGGFLGTAIAPKYFITAAHVGGSIGDSFLFGDVPYPTIAAFDDPETDLRIWRICGTFPSFAPLYTNNNEVGASLVVFGRGTRRGVPVTTTNLLGTVKTHGWKWDWSLYDGVQRWGENVVAAIVNGDGLLGDAGVGEVLKVTFDAPPNIGPNECHLSVGDSAGAVFIQNGTGWQLAGINLAVDGPYNTTDMGDGFDAAVFDAGGLYTNTVTGSWVLTPDLLQTPQPGSFYSTRISSRMSWINSILSGPDPADSQPILQSSANVSGPYADVEGATIDSVGRTITLPLPGQAEFYRLRSCAPGRIRSIQVAGGNVVLSYE